MATPYISFVVWTRNDDYVDDQLRRQQASLDVLMEQMDHHQLASEIIIVEWNPPADRPSLMAALSIPSSTRSVSVRFITAPPDYHRKYAYWDKRGIHSSVAINVGIRRARGRFVLPRGQDVFYSEALTKFLSETSLSPDCVYRCSRYDVDPGVLDAVTKGAPSFLDVCAENVVLHHDSDWCADLPDVPNLHMGSPGDFLLMSSERWHVIRGFRESSDVCSLDDDNLVLHAAHGSGAKQVLLDDECRVYKPAHDSISRIRLGQVYSPLLLLARDVARLMAPKRLRHRFCEAFNVPKRTVRDLDGAVFDSFERSFLPIARRWAKGIGPFHLNEPDWGLAGASLHETTVCRGDWDTYTTDLRSC